MGNETTPTAPAKNTVRLTKAIKAHGGETKVLEFSEPDGEAIMECGYPFVVLPGAKNEPTKVQLDAKVIGAYISKLANIPPSSVKMIAPADFMACTNIVSDFFGGIPVT